jgi:hypothetical protein
LKKKLKNNKKNEKKKEEKNKRSHPLGYHEGGWLPPFLSHPID